MPDGLDHTSRPDGYGPGDRRAARAADRQLADAVEAGNEFAYGWGDHPDPRPAPPSARQTQASRRRIRRNPWPSVWIVASVCGAVGTCAHYAASYFTAEAEAAAAASTAQSAAHARVLTAQTESEAAVLGTYSEALKAGGAAGGCGWIIAQSMQVSANGAPEPWAMELCGSTVSGRYGQ